MRTFSSMHAPRPRVAAQAVVRAAALAGMLALALPADAGTGIYWNFINNTAQNLYLHPQGPDSAGCWDPSGFADDTPVPANSAIVVYVERTGCVDSDFTVEVSGGEYDGSLARLWTDSQRADVHVPVRRNVHEARSEKVIPTVSPLAIGTSNAGMTTSIKFTGAGYYDTAAAWVIFAPGGSPMPPGSYRDTCVGQYDATSGDLVADCANAVGGIQYDSVLHYAEVCAPGSSVSNDQGRLECDTPRKVGG